MKKSTRSANSYHHNKTTYNKFNADCLFFILITLRVLTVFASVLVSLPQILDTFFKQKVVFDFFDLDGLTFSDLKFTVEECLFLTVYGADVDLALAF